jgi:hypothetical protein
MVQNFKKIFLLAFVLMASACALRDISVIKFYEGPELSKEKIAIIREQRLNTMRIIFVDGKSADIDGLSVSGLKLLPGKHTIIFQYVHCDTYTGCHGCRDSLIAEVELKAGHIYEIQGERFRDYHNRDKVMPLKVVIVDATNKRNAIEVQEVPVDESRRI